MEIKELKAGDICVSRGCEGCTCSNFGKVMKIAILISANGTQRHIPCRNANIYTEEPVVMNSVGDLLLLSWLSTYPHLEAWHGN